MECSSTERGKGLIRRGVDVLWMVIEGNQTQDQKKKIYSSPLLLFLFITIFILKFFVVSNLEREIFFLNSPYSETQAKLWILYVSGR